ncbi:MAG: hypothetical protein AB1540_15495 [Bdellovibrionota bacterium]
MKLKKAKIVIQSIDDVKREWKKALGGKLKSIQDEGMIIFVSLESLSKIMTSERLEVLSVILKEKPKSIYALAKLIGRDFKNVHSDVKLLAEIGLIDLKSHGKRESLQPVAKYSGFELDLAA